MPYTEAQKRATLKYQKENLVQLSVRMKPEEKKVIIQAAEEAGVSVKNLILELIKNNTVKK